MASESSGTSTEDEWIVLKSEEGNLEPPADNVRSTNESEQIQPDVEGSNGKVLPESVMSSEPEDAITKAVLSKHQDGGTKAETVSKKVMVIVETLQLDDTKEDGPEIVDVITRNDTDDDSNPIMCSDKAMEGAAIAVGDHKEESPESKKERRVSFDASSFRVGDAETVSDTKKGKLKTSFGLTCRKVRHSPSMSRKVKRGARPALPAGNCDDDNGQNMFVDMDTDESGEDEPPVRSSNVMQRGKVLTSGKGEQNKRRAHPAKNSGVQNDGKHSISTDDNVSSSDVDVIDENASEIHISQDFVHCPLDFSITAGSSSTAESNLASSSVQKSTSISSAVVEGATQTNDSRDCHLFEGESTSSEYTGLLKVAGVALVVLLLLSAFTAYLETDYVAQGLMNIHNNISVCLAEQRSAFSTVIGPEDFMVCEDKNSNYLHLIKHDLNAEVTSYLRKAQESFVNDEILGLSKGPITKDEIQLIVCQMEYYKVLPQKICAKLITKLPEASKIRTKKTTKVVFEEDLIKLQELIENLTVIHQEILDETEKFKVEMEDMDAEAESSPWESDGRADSPRSETCKTTVSELQEKVEQLLLENKILKLEIAAISGANNSIKADSAKVSTTDDLHNDSVENSQFEHFSTIASLAKQIENIRSSLSDELAEVKKWNALIENITSNLKNQFLPNNDEESQWSWQDLKVNVENVIHDAQKDISSTISSIQNVNISDMLREYFEGNKKQAENVLNSINHYFKVARETAEELLVEKEQEKKKESGGGTWGIWSNIKSHWSKMKEDVKQFAAKFHGGARYKKEKMKNDYTESRRDEKDNKGKMRRGTAEESWKLKKDSMEDAEREARRSNWLFKRAADREKLRKAADNWYLRRSMYHERERKKKSTREEL